MFSSRAVNESDMLLVPVPDTAVVDPFAEIPTLVMICMVQDPITREDYSRDPRVVADDIVKDQHAIMPNLTCRWSHETSVMSRGQGCVCSIHSLAVHLPDEE